MFRHWRIAGAVLCGILFLASLTLFTTSFIVAFGFEHQRPKTFVQIGCSGGQFTYSFQTLSPAYWSTTIPWRTYVDSVRFRGVGFWSVVLGFSNRHGVRVYNTQQAGKTITVSSHFVRFPIWPLLAFSASFPIWVFSRSRRKVRWAARDGIAWMGFRLRSKLRRFAIFSVVGAISGAGLGWIDHEFQLWRSPEEWSLTLLVLLPIVNILVILTRRNIPWRRGLIWMSLEIAGFLCFFIATLQKSWDIIGGWSVPDVNLAPGALLMGAVSFVISAGVLLLLQLKPRAVKPGPYCPACGYCLIGSPRQICAECGRAFTLEELGITPEELIPNSKLAVRA